MVELTEMEWRVLTAIQGEQIESDRSVPMRRVFDEVGVSFSTMMVVNHLLHKGLVYLWPSGVGGSLGLMPASRKQVMWRP